MGATKSGDTVKIHYTGKFDDGTIFDSSIGREPLEFKTGAGAVIPGFEEAVLGMNKGDKKSFQIPPEKAYGPRVDEALIEVPKGHFPEDMEIEVGHQLQISQDNGQSFVASVVAIAESAITLDANHPLAGKNLNFEIELLEIA